MFHFQFSAKNIHFEFSRIQKSNSFKMECVRHNIFQLNIAARYLAFTHTLYLDWTLPQPVCNLAIQISNLDVPLSWADLWYFFFFFKMGFNNVFNNVHTRCYSWRSIIFIWIFFKEIPLRTLSWIMVSRLMILKDHLRMMYSFVSYLKEC